MTEKVFSNINETLYTETLPNGLTVVLLPKKDYHKTYALFTTDYGSIDNVFKPLGEKDFCEVPDGIAHFLEHKMFEKEAGDVFQTFGKFGASANAFTSFTKTSYLFSSTEKVKENLTTLLDFVQDPYFTKETVEKEKGIIGQEIQMYQDDPDWRLFFGLLNNLYPNHPLHIDIAGTVESIQKITAEDLYLCYRTFYHPSNMNLVVVGNIDPKAIMELIRENQSQKDFAPVEKIARRLPNATSKEIVQTATLKMPVSRPKVVFGIKGIKPLPKDITARMRQKLALQMLFSLLFGSTSKNCLDLYDQGIIDQKFGYELTMDRDYYFADISTDTEHVETFITKIQEILLNFEESVDLTAENLARLKKRMLGKHLQSLNSLEYLARQLSQYAKTTFTYFDLFPLIEELTLEQIIAFGKQFIQEEAFSTFTIYPNEN